MLYDQTLDFPNIATLFDHKRRRFFNKDKVAISGDAAHGSIPRQSAATGQAVEDAYVLCSLLEHGPGPISRRNTKAFEASVAIRPPQAQ